MKGHDLNLRFFVPCTVSHKERAWRVHGITRCKCHVNSHDCRNLDDQSLRQRGLPFWSKYCCCLWLENNLSPINFSLVQKDLTHLQTCVNSNHANILNQPHASQGKVFHQSILQLRTEQADFCVCLCYVKMPGNQSYESPMTRSRVRGNERVSLKMWSRQPQVARGWEEKRKEGLQCSYTAFLKPGT